MDNKIIGQKQDMTYLRWDHVRGSSGTVGMFLKSEESVDGKKRYYKLSAYDSEKGIIGHECINELIVDRLLTLLGVEHLSYTLIHGSVLVQGKEYDTWFCASDDFKKNGERKVPMDDYYQMNADPGQDHYDFCCKCGWKDYINTMLAVDYLVLNRDRHGANIEVLSDFRKRTTRLAPLFDHGLSLLCSALSEREIKEFDVNDDRPCNNYIGTRSVLDNLDLIDNKRNVFPGKLSERDKEYLFYGLDDVVSDTHKDKIWDMIWTRWNYYENL